MHVYIVFDNCEPDGKIMTVTNSLEGAIQFLGNFGRYDKQPKLHCQFYDSWRYEYDDRAFLITKHYVREFCGDTF